MWTVFSRIFNYSFGMIYGFAHRAVHFLGRMRRFQLPWYSPGNPDTLPVVATLSEEQSECTPIIPITSNLNIPTDSNLPSVSKSTLLASNGFPNKTTPIPSLVMECETKTNKKYSKKKEKFIPDSNQKNASKRKAAEGEEGISSKKNQGKKAKTALKTSGEPPRPNHFIAIQVSNPEILAKVSDLQQKMLSKEVTSKTVNKFSKTAQIFHDTMVRKEKLHFTLHVFHLKNDNDHKEKAKSALENCFLKFKSEFENNPLRLNIEGLGHFRHGVIFAKIQGSEEISRLEALSLALRTEFENINIPGDPKPFRPHMTIAKLSKSKTVARKKIRSYPPEIWSDYQAEHLGYQTVESLQLLSMMETDPNTGYYGSIAQFDFRLLDSLSEATKEEAQTSITSSFNATTPTATAIESTVESQTQSSISHSSLEDCKSEENSNTNDPIEASKSTQHFQ